MNKMNKEIYPYLNQSLMYFQINNQELNEIVLQNLYKKYIYKNTINSNLSLELRKYNYYNTIHYKILENTILYYKNINNRNTLNNIQMKIQNNYTKLFNKEFSN